ncbi:hypothetical protein [Roseibium sp.]|uniref:hypothetical protein n=1 Tax=Roseibium sp. TaxID=1936156 RepID=UPI003A96E04F
MERTIAMLLIGLLFGGGIGFVTAAATNSQFEPHDHGNPAHHAAADSHAQVQNTQSAGMSQMASHDHSETLAATPGPEAPSLTMQIIADPMTGWNVHLMPTHFAFAPERASTKNIAGEGHAHLYVNGEKVARVYGPWFHLSSLPKGNVEIRAALYSNDHKGLTLNGAAVESVQTLTIE